MRCRPGHRQLADIRKAATRLFHPTIDIAASLIRLRARITFAVQGAVRQGADLAPHEHEITTGPGSPWNR